MQSRLIIDHDDGCTPTLSGNILTPTKHACKLDTRSITMMAVVLLNDSCWRIKGLDNHDDGYTTATKHAI